MLICIYVYLALDITLNVVLLSFEIRRRKELKPLDNKEAKENEKE